MNKFLLFFLIVLFFPSVRAIPELPNQFYGSVNYLNELIPNGHKLIAQLGEEKFKVNIINGKYGIETPLLVSKDSSSNINKIDFYVDNKKILTQDYNSGGFTELNLNVPPDIVMINETTIEDLNLKIGNTNNLSEEFTGVQEIEFKENDKPLVKFDYDFDSNTVKDLLENMIIKKQEETATEGFIIIKGVELPLKKTKTVYVDRLKSNSNAVCILDEEISSISEISSDCINGVKINCPGSNGDYSCSVEGNRFKITGLKHSGVKEFYIAPPSNPPSTSGSPSGGGGGGGGGAPTITCKEDWECKSWSVCKPGNIKTCFVWADKNNCKTVLNKPADVADCVYEGEVEEAKEEVKTEGAKGMISTTGAVVGFAKKNSIYLGIGVIALAIIFGIWQGSNYIRRKRDNYF